MVHGGFLCFLCFLVDFVDSLKFSVVLVTFLVALHESWYFWWFLVVLGCS